MALSRFEVNAGTKGKAQPHFLYITGGGKYAEKNTEIVFVQSKNMPSWVLHPSEFWQASDEFERKNGSVYREHLLSLPRELTRNQNIQLINDWIDQHIKHQPLTLAYHETIARDGNIQPHCHLMFCERIDDGIERTKEQFFKRYNSKNPAKGGAKKSNTGKKQSERQQELLELRQDWGEHLKAHLRQNGFEQSAEKVDMRNYIERGATPPEPQKPIWIINAEREKAQSERAINEMISTEHDQNPTQRLQSELQPDKTKTHLNRDDDFDFSM